MKTLVDAQKFSPTVIMQGGFCSWCNEDGKTVMTPYAYNGIYYSAQSTSKMSPVSNPGICAECCASGIKVMKPHQPIPGQA